MRVLWLTNIPMPGAAALTGSKPEVVGGWMSALLEELAGRGEMDLAVGTFVRGKGSPTKGAVGGVTYYGLPAGDADPGRVSKETGAAFSAVLEDFGADLVHVHGTEKIYGLYTASLSNRPPVVISIQGLLHECAHHATGGVTWKAAATSGIHGVLSLARSLAQGWRWTKRGEIEKRVVAAHRYFIGRTEWDQARVLSLNEGAHYFSCQEIVRPAFYSRAWSRGKSTATLFCSAAHSPMKGFHVVVEALAILRKEFPQLSARVANAPWDASGGRGYYGRYLVELIGRRGLSSAVVGLPSLTADEMAAELEGAAAFVLSSFVENSPNSLAEAMIVGTPCVAALVGGVPSMIEPGVTALGVRAGDPAELADRIRHILRGGTVVERMSENARMIARARHDVDGVIGQLKGIYSRVMAGEP